MNNKKKYLFICSSEYAVFNSINAVLNNIEGCKGADIVIFHRTDNLKKISDRIKESKIFSNVFDFSFIAKKSTFSLLMLFVFPALFLRRLCLNGHSACLMKNHYDVLVSQSQLYASLFRRTYKNVDVYFIEDGLSSYTSRTVNSQKRSLYFHWANKIFFNGTLAVKKQLLYKPDMYSGNTSNILKLPIPKKEFFNLYNQIFQYRLDTLYKTFKFIYLGTPYYGLKDLMLNPRDASSDLEDNCKLIVENLLKVPKKTKFIYRVHPIENIDKDNYKEICKFDIYNNMWEVECQNTISDQHVLVSFFSTALFTPKMLYNKEPYLIFLYKILGIELFNANKLIRNLKSTYSNPEKIMLVENIEELFEIVSKLELMQE